MVIFYHLLQLFVSLSWWPLLGLNGLLVLSKRAYHALPSVLATSGLQGQSEGVPI